MADSTFSDLHLLNSITRQKDKFVPKKGRTVQWYSCGPTVYDSAHMGHARSYITFDILRRVLRDYFHYDVNYVMNITDVDDKIIRRSRQRYLFESYKNNKDIALSKVLSDLNDVKAYFEEKVNKENDKEKLVTLKDDLDAINSASNNAPFSRDSILEMCCGQIMDWLDNEHGHEVTNNDIFSELPKIYEAEFFKDMQDLNVQPPDMLSRVSDYIAEIISFIECILEQGFAYESQGSVYFDVTKFASNDKHSYAKLVPEAVGDLELLQDGEGSLSSSKTEKRSPRDFALWKKSKSGEPSWESPWGGGRPGWHIECSAMAGSLCGQHLDIHTGGIDLKFPHHDNELAQSEAYFGCDDWVKYFVHAGHLEIEGRKMSKSLKNFITIREALQKYSSQQIRLLFLTHDWSGVLDYCQNTMQEALSIEKYLNEFFLNVKNILRTKGDYFPKFGEVELKLHAVFENSKCEIHSALCDSINTAKVMLVIRRLITECNSYIQSSKPHHELLNNIAIFVTSLLRVFGVIPSQSSIGFPSITEEGNVEEHVMPFLNALSDFRSDMRARALETLSLCDTLRDKTLTDLGARFEDHDGRPVIKLVGKKAIEKEKELAEAQKKAREKAALAKKQKSKINPKEMFLSQTDKFSKFDVDGMPTHDAKGDAISKAQHKRLKKLYDKAAAEYIS